ncbi:MAG TPA: hypothetical protein VFM12_05770 [Gemmatimonadales bacterium]|nr:hypothetical protein [Gemmatimonadales bacterium]
MAPTFDARDAAMRQVLLATLLLAAACGGESGPSDDNDADGHLTAVIEGEDFSSDPVYVNLGVNVTSTAPGLYVITGAHVEGTSSTGITITIFNVRGPGTYPIGVGATVVGGSGVVAEGGKGWGTDLSGSAGSITITELTATRIKGTFNFTAQAVTGGASGTRSVTDGDFDLKVNSGGTLPTVPDQNGSSASGTVGTTPWTASTIATGGVTSGIFLFNAGNTVTTTTVTISNFTGVGTYPLETGLQARTVAVSGPVSDPNGSNCCWGAGAGMSGSIVITSATSTRIKGSYDVTLPAIPGGDAVGTITTSGTFDIGLPQLP